MSVADHSRGGAVSAIEFADRRLGFAFGGDLWRTTDAGRTWHRLSLPALRTMGRAVGQPTVTSLAVAGSVVYMVGDLCNSAGQQCQLGALYETARSGRVRRVSDLPTLGKPGGFFDGTLSVEDDVAYFTVNATVDGSRLYERVGQGWVRRVDPCGGGSESDGLVADGPALIDFCTGYLGQDRGARSVAFVSHNGGASWHKQGEIGFAKAPTAATRAGADLYVADDELGGHVYRSVNIGRHWSIVRTLPRSADGWSSLDFPTRREGFAIAVGRHPTFLVTRDDGSTWHPVQMFQVATGEPLDRPQGRSDATPSNTR
jgi:photosystem II stability/assembly factor-like uncharacterized protein